MHRKRQPTQSAPALRRRRRKQTKGWCTPQLFSSLVLIGGILVVSAIGFLYEFSKTGNHHQYHSPPSPTATTTTKARAGAVSLPSHLVPIVPVLPAFAPVPNANELAKETLEGKNPTVAGIVAILQNFLSRLHESNQDLVAKEAEPIQVIQTFFDLTITYLRPLEETYRDKSIFPIREDGSIFLSLAAFREHLLADTLVYAFSQAKDPTKLFVGAVVQNCFGRVLEDGTIDSSGKPCKTGAQVVGKNKKGKDMTKVSDAPVDRNGIEEFCNMPEYKIYCDNGQIRALYVHETESLGPAMARYYASKLWGGETYFVQTDSHLQFAKDWDEKYKIEIRATRNYPKSVLSSYPPGFQKGNGTTVPETNGSRLCHCETNALDPNPIVRINTGRGYQGDEPRPTQIPFIAAGFFFARSEFLIDVPFDPYIPWCFMGEEIALSMRAWTHGWDIYAPRKNLITHQYRPGRMGLPKFWGTVNRLFSRPAMNNRIQGKIIKRIKHMVGYPDSTLEKINSEQINFILKDIEHYSIGSVRSWDEYMEFSQMSIDNENDAIVCSRIPWCNQGLKD